MGTYGGGGALVGAVCRRYGSANVWKCCTDVFDYLSLSAIIEGCAAAAATAAVAAAAARDPTPRSTALRCSRPHAARSLARAPVRARRSFA